MNKGQRPPKTIRDTSPCDGCTERFIACSDRCPKDERGDYGYKAFKAEIARVKNARKQHINRVYVRKKNHNGGEEYGKE